MISHYKPSRSKIYLHAIISKNKVKVNAESLLAIFTLQCCSNADIDTIIVFVQKNFPYKNKLAINANLSEVIFLDTSLLNYEYNIISPEECPEIVNKCFFPAIMTDNQPWVIAGLSSSLRFLLSTTTNKKPNHISNMLLGFKKSCLQACAEVSTWTKFCEIEIVKMLQEICEIENITVMPKDILRFEYHLSHPPIVHNVLKKKQIILGKDISDIDEKRNFLKKKLTELPELDHIYAEGTDFTLADILLYAPIKIAFNKLKNLTDFQKLCPRITRWLNELENKYCVKLGKAFLDNVIVINSAPLIYTENDLISIPKVSGESLYKSDPKRYKPRWRSFTCQKDVDQICDKLKSNFKILQKEIDVENIFASVKKKNESCDLEEHITSSNIPNIELSKFSDMNLNNKMEILDIYDIIYKSKFEWESFPLAVNLTDGSQPLKRYKRKQEQLESMAQIVVGLAKKGDIIVDFCAGGGHLGVFLAYLLPHCKIYLVENKSESLLRADKRVQIDLKLRNVQFYQCNLDYFTGKFDIGVCLHACGTATDLVLKKCYESKASFVCCPCCYGSVKPNHILNYPRSNKFKDELKISLSEYLILSHAADQTHGDDNPKTEQGKLCMNYVDTDRLSYFNENNYSTCLARMNPANCTPKNHILVGYNIG